MIDLWTILTMVVEDFLEGDSENHHDLIASLHEALEGAYGRFW